MTTAPAVATADQSVRYTAESGTPYCLARFGLRVILYAYPDTPSEVVGSVEVHLTVAEARLSYVNDWRDPLACEPRPGDLIKVERDGVASVQVRVREVVETDDGWAVAGMVAFGPGSGADFRETLLPATFTWINRETW